MIIWMISSFKDDKHFTSRLKHVHLIRTHEAVIPNLSVYGYDFTITYFRTHRISYYKKKEIHFIHNFKSFHKVKCIKFPLLF